MIRQELLNVVDRVDILNNPYLGYRYNIRIDKNGIIRYQNNIDCKDGALFMIKSVDAGHIIDHIKAEIFCYDSDNHGKVTIDGYYWEISFYGEDELIDKIEGWPDEDERRYSGFKSILCFVERCISKDLGTEYMK